MKNKWIKAIITYSICVLVSACSITDEDRMRWAREAKERDLRMAENAKREERDRLASEQRQRYLSSLPPCQLARELIEEVNDEARSAQVCRQQAYFLSLGIYSMSESVRQMSVRNKCNGRLQAFQQRFENAASLCRLNIRN